MLYLVIKLGEFISTFRMWVKILSFFFLIFKFHRTAIFLDCTILVFIHLFFFLFSLFVRAKKIIFAMAEKYFSSLLQMAACVLPAFLANISRI